MAEAVNGEEAAESWRGLRMLLGTRRAMLRNTRCPEPGENRQDNPER